MARLSRTNSKTSWSPISQPRPATEEGAKFEAGRMGEFTITKDPTRAKGLRVLMGPFTVYNKDNVEAAAK